MTSGAPGHESDEPVVRDKRRIDPDTGAVRPEAASVHGPRAAGGPAGMRRRTVGARTTGPRSRRGTRGAHRGPAAAAGGVRQLPASRVERDREAVRELAVIASLSELLPVLDDIGRARAHGELVGGFKVVAESLEATLGKLGLAPFGAAGTRSTRTSHEALMHEYSAEVTEPTCVAVLQPGYRVGERVMRPARVRVAEPEPAAEPVDERRTLSDDLATRGGRRETT